MRLTALMLAARLLTAHAVLAQTITIQPSNKSPLPALTSEQNRPTRIRVQMTLSERLTSNGIDEQRMAAEAVRRALYETALNECAVLTSVFNSDCRLASLNVNTNAVDRHEFHTINGNLNAQFEVMPNR